MMSFLMWLVGLLTGAAAVKLYNLKQEGRLRCDWYHYLIGIGWYLGGLFVVGFVGVSFAEGEPQAAGMALLIFGGLYLVVSILLYRFLYAPQIDAGTSRKAAA